MAQNSLLINEPILLCIEALKSFKHLYDDPLTFTVKFWSDILSSLDLNETGINTTQIPESTISEPKYASTSKIEPFKPKTTITKFDHLETLLSYFIQDYSIWYPAINSVSEAFYLSNQGQKALKADENLYKTLNWYIFYNDQKVYPNLLNFLGGSIKAKKFGILQKCTNFVKFLIGNEKNVKLVLYGVFTNHYDVNFVQENLLPRYDINFIRELYQHLQLKNFKPKYKKLTIPKSPNFVLKDSKERLADLEHAQLLDYIAFVEANQSDRIIYANRVPESTYYCDDEMKKLGKVSKFKPTIPQEFNLTDSKVKQNIPIKLNSNFKATPMPKFKTQDSKQNNSTILRKIAILKKAQQDSFNKLMSQQFASDQVYNSFKAKVNLENAINDYEKTIQNKLSANLSFENAILAANAVVQIKTEQNGEFKKLMQIDLEKYKNDLEQDLIKKGEFAKNMDQGLKQGLAFAKQNLLEDKSNNVKIQSLEMKNLINQAIKIKRIEFETKRQLIDEIKTQEREFNEMVKNGGLNKKIDKFSTTKVGLLNEMSLAEMKLRFEYMKKAVQEANDELNNKIKREKIDKQERIDNTYEKLKRFENAEKRKKQMERENAMKRQISVQEFQSKTTEMLQKKLENARNNRIMIQKAAKV